MMNSPADSFDAICSGLKMRLESDKPLPGALAQKRFAPDLTFGRHAGIPAWNARRAAVLILILPDHDDHAEIPFIIRPEHMKEHAGQTSFPGGAIDPGETSLEAALRELNEELGCDVAPLRIIGKLSRINLYNSNYLVEPWVASCPVDLAFTPNPSEVADWFRLPIGELLNEKNYAIVPIQRGKLQFSCPCIQWRNREIWGATSMICGELIQILNESV